MDFRTEFYTNVSKSNCSGHATYLTDETISPKQVKSLNKHYAKDLEREDIVAVCDITTFGFGKRGCVITEKGFYSSDIGTTYNKGIPVKNPILFDNCVSMKKDNALSRTSATFILKRAFFINIF